jgi:hypothetical protein
VSLNNGIDLFIGREQFLLRGVEQDNSIVELGATVDDFVQQFAAFADQHRKQCAVTIFIGDDLLYFTRIYLPKQTPDVEKAISLQLDTLSPFGEDCFYGSDVQYEKENIAVSLYLVDQRVVLPVLETMTGLGCRIYGMYPESQRGLNQDNRKKTWGLLSQGLFTKLTIFKDGHVVDRVQLSGEWTVPELEKTYGLECVEDSSQVMSASSLLTSAFAFDLLPEAFRRTDYLKRILTGLAGLNLILAVLWLSMNFINLQSRINTLTAMQNELAPQLQEVSELQKQQVTQTEKLKRYASIEKNRNLIDLFAVLTRELPASSYLDQFRMDKKTGAIHIQGYTTDLNELTTRLQGIGRATLESTRKRKGQTYFQIEVLPE